MPRSIAAARRSDAGFAYDISKVYYVSATDWLRCFAAGDGSPLSVDCAAFMLLSAKSRGPMLGERGRPPRPSSTAAAG